MAEHLIGHGQAGRHQHRRPVHSMKAEDVLADHMDRRRPAAAVQSLQIWCAAVVQQSGEVAEKRIEPHIKRVTFMIRNRQSPGNIDPGN